MLWRHWFVVAFVFAFVITFVIGIVLEVEMVLQVEIELVVKFVEVVDLEILELEFGFGWYSEVFCKNTQQSLVCIGLRFLASSTSSNCFSGNFSM